MRIPRIYHPTALRAHSQIELSNDGANHVGRVLRMGCGDLLQLFDGSNQIFTAHIVRADKKKVLVQIEEGEIENNESSLNLHLGQVISRGERMEFTIQKAVELGVNIITPLLSERCGVRLAEERMEKKIEQRRKIAIAACEQCGRNRIPDITPP